MAEMYRNTDNGYEKITLSPSMIDTNRSETFVKTMTRNASKNDITSDLSSLPSWMGSTMFPNQAWYNVISVRHRNGTDDGGNYGMCIYSNLTNDDDLKFVHHYNGSWANARTLIDDKNPEIVVSSTQPSNSNAKIWIKA